MGLSSTAAHVFVRRTTGVVECEGEDSIKISCINGRRSGLWTCRENVRKLGACQRLRACPVERGASSDLSRPEAAAAAAAIIAASPAARAAQLVDRAQYTVTAYLMTDWPSAKLTTLHPTTYKHRSIMTPDRALRGRLLLGVGAGAVLYLMLTDCSWRVVTVRGTLRHADLPVYMRA